MSRRPKQVNSAKNHQQSLNKKNQQIYVTIIYKKMGKGGRPFKEPKVSALQISPVGLVPKKDWDSMYICNNSNLHAMRKSHPQVSATYTLACLLLHVGSSTLG